jgi:hypothetical protein
MRFLDRRTLIGLATAGLAAASAAPDEILLRGGGRVHGMVVERTADAVVIDTGPGRVTLAASRVLRIVESRSALEGFRERAAALEPGDAPGWAELARWAAERELDTQAREAWRRVLAADPNHPGANAALGRVEFDGTWMPEDQAHRLRGEVSFEGRWVTPAEHEALVRERETEEAGARERRQSELRVREAEAQAREAEARAREAEAAAQQSTADGGIPLWWGGSGGILLPPMGPWPPESHPPTRPPHIHPHSSPPPSPGAPPPKTSKW